MPRSTKKSVDERACWARPIVDTPIHIKPNVMGDRAALGVSIIPPYATYFTYDVYIVPGSIAMVARWLFAAMVSLLQVHAFLVVVALAGIDLPLDDISPSCRPLSSRP